MIRKRKIELLALVILFSLVFSGVSGIAMQNPYPSSFLRIKQQSERIPLTFGREINKSFNDDRSINPAMPDVVSYVDTNISGYDVPGAETFVGDQVITGVSGDYYHVEVSILAIYVIDDHDGIGLGAGEIFVEGTVNGNYSRYPGSGNEFAINSGENYTTNIKVLDTRAIALNFTFEVRDADTADADDSLGFASFYKSSLSNETLDLVTDIGDAHLYVSIEVTSLETQITAYELLNGYRPFISVDDETDKTEMPDYVVGRVVKGSDGGTDALVLQYYLYWESENSPDGGVYSFELHKNDFEALLVFLKVSDISKPYRIVFNNWQYTNLDDFPNEQLLILEEGVVTPSEQTFVTNISKDLQPLLGINTEQTVKIDSIDRLNNWEYDTTLNLKKNVWRTSLIGYQTFDVCVDTSYHTFDLGPGGTVYGYEYQVFEMNDTLISDWYKEIDRTFVNGTHVWSYFGVDVPIVAPFTHDVTGVFQAPYVISAYHNVVEKAGAVALAKKSGLNITQEFNAKIGFHFDGDLVVTPLSALSPGQAGELNLSLDFDPNNFFVDIGFDYLINASLAYWFAQSQFTYNTSVNLKLQIPLGTISSVLESLGFIPYTIEDVSIASNFLTLSELTINPSFVGTLVNGSIDLQIWEIVKAALLALFPEAKPVLDVIDFFVDSISLSMLPILESRLQMNIATTGGAVNETSIEFSQGQMHHVVSVTPDNGASGISFEVSDVNYVLVFQNNWLLGVYFKSPLSLFVDDLTWDLGIYPAYTGELLSSPGGSVSIGVSTTTSSSTSSSTGTSTSSTSSSTGSSTTTSAASPLENIFLMMFSSFLLLVVVISRKKR